MSASRHGGNTQGGPSQFPPRRDAIFPRVMLLALTVALVVPTPGGAAETSRATVDIEMLEFAFRPRTIHLKVGMPVRVVLRNRGQIAHQLESSYLRQVNVRLHNDALHVEAPGLDIARLNPGGFATLEFLPRRTGRFVLACTIEGHREAGMTGILEVR